MKKFLSFLLAAIMLLALTACGGSDQPQEETSAPSAEESAPEPEPEPEPEPFVIPDPVTYSGTGDNVIAIEPYEDIYVFRIEGNSGANHFAVTSYDENGEYLQLLVNTTEPYSGVVVDPSQTTAMMEIKATGDWTITVDSIYSTPAVFTGETISGTCDTIFMSDGKAKTADISGNYGKNHFAVIAYSDYSDLLVNTTDPYNGTVMVPANAGIYEVKATGDWTITLN